MESDAIWVAASLIVAGVLMIGAGIWTRLGKNRSWYLVPNYYVLLPKTGHYALPIIGLMLITLSIGIIMPDPADARLVLFYVTFPLMILALTTVVFQPSWLKPKWVRWLEENHGDILEILISEGRETPNWGEKVSTQEGLEEWVEEVRRKRGLKRKRERR